MEHPKDIGDRSTLAIITVLRELGYGVYLPFGENTRCDLVHRTRRDIGPRSMQDGPVPMGAVRVRGVQLLRAPPESEGAGSAPYHGEVDCFAVYCPETAGVYLIPIVDICPYDVSGRCG